MYVRDLGLDNNTRLIHELNNLLLGEKTSNDYNKVFSENNLLLKNYFDYLVTSPLDVKIELERIPSADLELCYALMTMLFREDHFDNGSFERRIDDGSVSCIVRRIIELLI